MSDSEMKAKVITDDGLGDAATRHYFRPDEANHPTRITVKALANELLWEDVHSLRHLVPNPDIDYTVAQLRRHPGYYMRHIALIKLWKELYRWAVTGGLLPAGRSCPTWGTRTAAWKTVSNHIDWQYVARRLRDEYAQHAHRANLRACELEEGKPWEHIEADLKLKSSGSGKATV